MAPSLPTPPVHPNYLAAMSPSQPISLIADRYVVERLLGRGGMATVYLARDRHQDRLVAVKVLHEELAQSVVAERFLREIRVAAHLQHPNILPLHDSGRDGDLLYYVMPFVAGETLRSKLEREGPLTVEDALRITCEMAAALDHAHGHRILHRDIKPENILLSDGHAILADFGIARALDGGKEERMTRTGTALGTPAYMSPEQATGEARLDARSDLYALACVTYEMLTGEPPFTGPSAQSILAKRLAGPVPRIRTVRPTVPRGLETALLRALQPVPADRFATVGELAEALAVCTRDAAVFRGSRYGTRIAGTAALLATAGGIWLFAGPRGGPGSTLIAVLPLTYDSGDPAYTFLAEGLTAGVIGDLKSTPGVRVISGASVMRYASMPGPMASEGGKVPGSGHAMAPMAGGMAFMDPGGTNGSPDSGAGRMVSSSTSLSAIGRELGADLLVQASLSRDADSVRVGASIIRAASLEEMWRGSFNRHTSELSGLQHDLVDAILSTMPGSERGAMAMPARAYDPEAQQAYLKGNYFQAHWRLPEAIEAFDEAIRIDPRHAAAQAGLARAYYFMAFFGDLPPGIALGRMRRAAQAALEVDSLMAEAHAQLALVKMLQEWDWEGAEHHFRRALELSPGDAQIRHDYAHFLLGQGRQRESAEQTREAVALDPVNPMLISCLGWHSLFDARYEEAQRFASEANALMPDHWAFVVLGWSLLGRNERDSALVAFRKARRLSDGAFTVAALGHALAITGHEAEARAAIAELSTRIEDEYVSPYDIATVYAGLGEADETFRWLRRAAEERSTFLVHLGWDSRFDRVRTDARFAALVNQELRLPLPRFTAVTAPERRSM